METLMYVISFKSFLGLTNKNKQKINTDPYRSSQLSFDKGTKVIQWRKDSVSMVKLENLTSKSERMNLNLSLKMSHRFTCRENTDKVFGI